MHYKISPDLCPICKKLPKHRIIGTQHKEIHDFYCCIGASVLADNESEAIENWNALISFHKLKELRT